jgi:hypothetical protein
VGMCRLSAGNQTQRLPSNSGLKSGLERAGKQTKRSPTINTRGPQNDWVPFFPSSENVKELREGRGIPRLCREAGRWSRSVCHAN